LQDYYATTRRAAYLADLRKLPREALQEQSHGIRETLNLIIDQ